MEEAGREGEGMVFKDRDEAVMAYRNGYVHLHSRVGIATDSLNKPWTEEQKHKVLLTTVGKILFNDIMPEGLPYLQEPNNANLTEAFQLNISKVFLLEWRVKFKIADSFLDISTKWQEVFRWNGLLSSWHCLVLASMVDPLA